MMEIVIKIHEKDYQSMKNGHIPFSVHDVIMNGTPLPEHHGRLIDADELRRTMEKDVRKAMSFVDLADFVWLAPTIVQAVKE